MKRSKGLQFQHTDQSLKGWYESLAKMTGATQGQLRQAAKAAMKANPDLTEDKAIRLIEKDADKLFGRFIPSFDNRHERRSRIKQQTLKLRKFA
jgi:hypothetical protein